MRDQVEHHATAALRAASRIHGLVSASIGEDAETLDEVVEEFFGLADHLTLGVLEAIGRRPGPVFDYRHASE
ncbi:MAG: hypothetical protein WBZ37_16380 [Mycobacterium sp.]